MLFLQNILFLHWINNWLCQETVETGTVPVAVADQPPVQEDREGHQEKAAIRAATSL